MLLHVGCEFVHRCAEETPSLWQIRPRPDGPHRIVDEVWDPPPGAHSYFDAYGNQCDRFLLAPGTSTLRYDAVVEVPDVPDPIGADAEQAAIEDLPDEAFLYLLPSRFCWPETLYDEAWERFGDVEPGWARVQAVCDFVHAEVAYTPGGSGPHTTAFDVWVTRVGVCRDLSHLAMTLCRALNVPVRYVSGYLPDIGVGPQELPLDFCSWFEAWLGGRWWTFDPRNNVPRLGRVVIARGRDALDTAMVTTWGEQVLEQMTVWADEVGGRG